MNIKNLIITITSANRSQNVKHMQSILSPLVPIWIVPKHDEQSYLNAGAINVVSVDGEMPLKIKQLNKALEIGREKNCVVVTMDDDCQGSWKLVFDGDKKKMVKCTLSSLIEDVYSKFLNSSYMVGGIDQSTNAMFKNKEEQYYGMVGQLLFHKPNQISFDENIKFVEDLEYIINHHVTFGGIFRYNYYSIKFDMLDGAKYNGNGDEDKKYSGGFKGLRTNERQHEILKYIENKYNNQYVKFYPNTLVGTSLAKGVKWKKLTEKNSSMNVLDFI